MSILYIRLPSKAAADGVEHWLTLLCPFALTLQGEAIEREGVLPLSDLAAMVASAHRVVLLLAASDVTLLRVKTPPLSAAKLKLALPNLVEDQLMTDPAECVVVAGGMADGLRTVAVVQRGWLDILSKTFTSFGARSLAAVPAQLCLPYQTDSHVSNVAAAITEQGVDIDLALRTSEQDGIGLSIMPESSASAVMEVLAALRALVPLTPITLYVPQAQVVSYQQALHVPEHDTGAVGDASHEATPSISVFADDWGRWIGGASRSPVNLMTGLGASSGPQVNWRQWRWPLVLLSLLLLVNALGLNIDWWHLRQEAASLRTGMIQTFKSTYPKETVILDVVAQMHKKIADTERNAGQESPDDFGQLAANFSQALELELANSKSGKTPSAVIASIEYHERSLLVHFKPDSSVSMEKMKVALAARNLNLSSGANDAWQIRSSK